MINRNENGEDAFISMVKSNPNKKYKAIPGGMCSYHPDYGVVHYKRRFRLRTRTKALLFFLALVIVSFVSIIGVFVSSGPIILGTEMNTNGLVEHLCLGRGCELNNLMPAGGM